MNDRRQLARAFAALTVSSVAVLTPTAATAGGAQQQLTPAAVEVVRVNFDEITSPVGSVVTSIAVTGSANAVGAIAQRNSGVIRVASPRTQTGDAVQLPAFNGSATAPHAMVRVSNPTTVDALSPGLEDFTFGADFILDATSSQPGTSDDGDNLLQRGLFNDTDQYKLQVDARSPSCRLKGTSGTSGAITTLTAVSRVRVDSSHWYRASCVRTGRVLRVVVRTFNSDGSSVITTDSSQGAAVIDITMTSSAVPMSIGGKLNADGTVMVDSDQFNGRVDNARLQIG